MATPAAGKTAPTPTKYGSVTNATTIGQVHSPVIVTADQVAAFLADLDPTAPVDKPLRQISARLDGAGNIVFDLRFAP